MNLIFNFIIKEFLQFRRDRRMFVIILIAPVIQLVFLGYAANLDITNIRTVVWDQNRSSTSREYLNGFSKSGYFSMDYYVTSYDEMVELIDNGKAVMGIVIPPDFEKNIFGNKTAQVQFIFDGSDGNKASIAAGYTQSINLT